jgi:hypothetical protein
MLRNSINKNIESPRQIKLCFSDFHSKAKNRLFDLLNRHFNFEIDNTNPDYNIYSVFGNDYLKHKNCIRIFYTGENLRPDFNLCDYAFSFDWLEFGDRHFRAPNYVLFDEWPEMLRKKRSSINACSLSNKKFCNFIYSHGNGNPLRDEFFYDLNSIKKVDSLGPHLRNAYEPIGKP